MKEILIWSDFTCPFCYIGEKRLKDALSEIGLKKEFTIKYRAFELNRNAPKSTEDSIPELLSRKYNMTLVDATKKVEEIDRAGNEAGLVMNFGTAKSCNTLDAHRLMRFAQEKYGNDVADKLADQLFLAYFTENRLLSDHEVLEQCAVNAGMPTEEISRVLNSERYIKQVRNDEHEAEALGVKGVPFIVFDEKIAVPGALSTEDFKKVLEDVLKDLPADNIGQGSECCDEHGCRVK